MPHPVKLYLVRHGAAEDKLWKSDAERALTAQGRDDLLLVADRLRGAVEHPLRLLSSPYLRAEQTAEILRERLGIKEKLAPTNALLPEADWGQLRAVLEPLAAQGVANVVAVGHNPSISLMVATIIAGDEDARVSMAKGAAACLEIDDLRGRPAGELKWLLTPRALRGPRPRA